MLKGVFATDLHFPNHDPQCVKLLKKFNRDFSPGVFIYGGDWLNMTSMNHWLFNKDKMVEVSSIKDEYDLFNDFLDDFNDSLPKKCKKVFMMGNHEDWADQYKLMFPKVAKYISIEENLRFKERGIHVIPLNRVYKVGKMNFIHGYYTNDFHTKKSCQVFRSSVFYGHSHDIQTFSSVSPIDKDQHQAHSVGCLCNCDPDWLKSRPNRWQQGFLPFYVQPNGFYNDYQVRIINGKFVWGEKLYEA